MSVTTTIRSWSGILVGVFFTVVTCYVLMEDVVVMGAHITTKHVMTLAVLFGTIYFGHRWWVEASHWRLGTTLGCSVLFLAGTSTCVLMSAGRNAEATQVKAMAAGQINADHRRLARDLQEAKARYDAALKGESRDVTEAKARYEAALKAEEDECGSGVGTKCIAKRAITAATRADVDAAEVRARTAAQAQLTDLRHDVETAEAKLAQAKPEQVANADIRAMASLLAKVPYVTTDVDRITVILLLFFPFLQALFCEVAAIVGYSIGLGHKRVAARTVAKYDVPQLPPPAEMPMAVLARADPEAVSVPSVARVAEQPETAPVAMEILTESQKQGYLKAKRQRPTDVQMVLSALEQAGRPVSNDELAALLRVSKGESSKRIGNCGDAILIRRNGRHYAISPNYGMAV